MTATDFRDLFTRTGEAAAPPPPVRPLDCGPGKVFVLELPEGHACPDNEWVDGMRRHFAEATGGSKLVVLPPGCKLRGGEGPTLTIRNDTDGPVTVDLDLTRRPAPPAGEMRGGTHTIRLPGGLEVPGDERLYEAQRLLSQPSPTSDWAGLYLWVEADLRDAGVAYLWLVPNFAGEVREVWRLNPAWVTLHKHQRKDIPPFYGVREPGAPREKRVSAAEVVALRRQPPAGEVLGPAPAFEPITLHARALPLTVPRELVGDAAFEEAVRSAYDEALRREQGELERRLLGAAVAPSDIRWEYLPELTAEQAAQAEASLARLKAALDETYVGPEPAPATLCGLPVYFTCDDPGHRHTTADAARACEKKQAADLKAEMAKQGDGPGRMMTPAEMAAAGHPDAPPPAEADPQTWRHRDPLL